MRHRNLKRLWCEPDTHNILKSNAAKEGLGLTEYLDKLVKEEKIVGKNYGKKIYSFP